MSRAREYPYLFVERRATRVAGVDCSVDLYTDKLISTVDVRRYLHSRNYTGSDADGLATDRVADNDDILLQLR